ncbi:MAG: choline kinase family protein [Steroidobacteraceae bacterium]
MSPSEFAALALHGHARNIKNVERIKHGLTNESWLVTLGAETVVVRISNPADASLQIDRESETSILHAVAAADIGPPILLCDPSQRVLVTRYLGPTWTDADAQKVENISRLGVVLRRLHALQPPAGVHRVKLVDVIDDYSATLSLSAAERNDSHDEARVTATFLDAAAHHCLCHNDVHALNIVDAAGALRLIDWEYAGVGSPLFDLASVCVYHGYSEAQREQLLSSYGRRPSSMEPLSMDALERACGLFDYVRQLWTQVRSTDGAGS